MTRNENIAISKVAPILIVFFALSVKASAQIFDTRGVIAPPSVTTDFLESMHNSVNYQTGAVNFSVRLLSLKVDDNFEIPIDLTYTVNGIRYYQSSGEAGVGWNISSNYKVTRTIYDRPDEFFPKPASTQAMLDSISTEKYTRDRYLARFTHGLPTDAGLAMSSSQTILDGEYDLFDYSTPTSSETFAIQDVANKTVIATKHLLAKIDYTTSPSDGIQSFSLQETNGNQVTCGYDPKRGGYISNYTTSYLVNKASIEWPVNKIVTPNNKSVEFSYIFRSVSEDRLNTERAVTIVEEVEAHTVPAETSSSDINDGTSGAPNVFLTDSIISQFGFIKIYRNPSSSSSLIDSVALFNKYNRLISKVILFQSSTQGYTFLDSLKFIGNVNEQPKVYRFDYYNRDNNLYLVPDIWDNLSVSNDTRTTEKAYPQELAQETYMRKDQVGPQPVAQIIGLGSDRSPVGTPDILSLKSITLPTGGNIAYTYEPNYYSIPSGEEQGPGIRVSSVSKFDPISTTTMTNYFTYGPGTIPVEVSSDMYGLDRVTLYEDRDDPGPYPTFYSGRVRTFSNTVISDNDPYFVRYNCVSYPTVRDSTGGNGVTVYYFDNSQQGNWAIQQKYGNGFFYNIDLYANSNINRIEYYDNLNHLKKVESYDYGRFQGTTLTGLKVKPYATFESSYFNFNPDLYSTYSFDAADLYNFTSYDLVLDKCFLANKSVVEYENGAIRHANSYYYSNEGQLLSEIDTLSNGAVRTITYTYANSYDSLSGTTGDILTNDILAMQHMNLLDNWVEKVTKLKRSGSEYIISSQFQTLFAGTNKPRKSFSFLNPNHNIFQLSTVVNGKVTIDPNYLVSRNELLRADNLGNSVFFRNDKSEMFNIIWGYSGSFPIAITRCGSASDTTDVAYTSFEPEGSGNWQYSQPPVSDPTAPMGQYSYNMNNDTITKTGLTSGAVYIVSYWSKNGNYTISGGTSSYVTGKTINGWTFYQHTVTALNSIISVSAATGNHYIDELRLYPSTAQMTTYNYLPLVGITSEADFDGKINSFQYDGLRRLLRTKDMDGNIIKQYNYQFQVANNQ